MIKALSRVEFEGNLFNLIKGNYKSKNIQKANLSLFPVSSRMRQRFAHHHTPSWESQEGKIKGIRIEMKK